MKLKKTLFILALVLLTIAGCSNNIEKDANETNEKTEDVEKNELSENKDSEEKEQTKEENTKTETQRVGALAFEESFSINGVSYKLPMTFAELKEIPGIEYEEEKNTELSGRISGTETLWLNHGEDNEVNISAEISNYSSKAINTNDAIVSTLTFSANPATLDKVNSWDNIITVDNGITFAIDYYDFIKNYDTPLDPNGVIIEDNTTTFVYDLDSDETDENRVELLFNQYDNEGKDELLLRSITIRIDDTEMNIKEDNNIN